MLQFLTIIKTIISILPILRDLIAAAEAFFPAQGSGIQKLELVRTLLQNAYETATKAEAPFASIWPTISNLIGYLVPITTPRSASLTSTAASQVRPTIAANATVVASGVVAATSTVGVQLATPDA